MRPASALANVAVLALAATLALGPRTAQAQGLLDALRDPFAVPARILKAMTAPPPPPPAPASAEPPAPAPIVEPPPPELRAVMVAGSESIANVGGTMLRIGERIDGHRLIDVRPRGAVFQRDDGKTVAVSLDTPGRGKTP